MTAADVSIALILVYLLALVIIRMFEGDKRGRIRGELNSADIAKALRKRGKR